MNEYSNEALLFKVVEAPKYKSKLIIYDESVFTVQIEKEMPCLWHRIWLKFLLGWTWEKIE